MKNHLIIIVGVGSSFGRSIAKLFGKQGYEIILMGRNTTKLEEESRHLIAEGIMAYPIVVDVTNSDSVHSAFDEIKKLDKTVDLLIYNAVARGNKKPSELTAKEVADDFSVTMGGAISCTNEILPFFKEQNNGAIIYTGGGVAITPSMNNASMSIGKAGLRNYVLNLSNELQHSRVFIGMVTITKLVEENTASSPEIVAEQYLNMFSERKNCETIL